ncbi:MAG: acyl-CoA dehydrogenase family protein [Rhodospirillaceae bacterium]
MPSISFIADNAKNSAFRSEVRNWLADNLPPDLVGWATRPPPGLVQPWYRKLYDRGWIAPHWPKEYGGMEASVDEQLILQEELGRAGAPVLSRQALNHIGPIIMKFGTQSQKDFHLPKMLSGEIMWCQGYSEPNSGSDLASLKTKGTVVGNEIVINGQKIWTTWGHHADWMYALIRTNQSVSRKQDGITMVLIDLRNTPGITIRPIKTIAGDEEFAEEFFDDVRIPITNVVGELDNGWPLAKNLMDWERIGNANPQAAFDVLERIRKVAVVTERDKDPVFQDKVARAEIRVVGQAAMFAHAVQLAKAEMEIGSHSSFIKLSATEISQDLADLLLEAAGSDAANLAPIETPDGNIDVATTWLQARRLSIFAGTSEIQRNIMAKRVLGLP